MKIPTQGVRKMKERKDMYVFYVRRYDFFFFFKEKEDIKTMIELFKEKELNRWRENQVYKEVEQKKEMNIISTK